MRRTPVDAVAAAPRAGRAGQNGAPCLPSANRMRSGPSQTRPRRIHPRARANKHIRPFPARLGRTTGLRPSFARFDRPASKRLPTHRSSASLQDRGHADEAHATTGLSPYKIMALAPSRGLPADKRGSAACSGGVDEVGRPKPRFLVRPVGPGGCSRPIARKFPRTTERIAPARRVRPAGRQTARAISRANRSNRQEDAYPNEDPHPFFIGRVGREGGTRCSPDSDNPTGSSNAC